jgi:hypothetical protein
MLMPDKNGDFFCKKDNFKTNNLFMYMEHFGVEYDWMIKLDKKYNFNLFKFLESLAFMAEEKDIDGIWEAVQSTTLLMINASGEDLDVFIEEATIISETEDMFDQIERFLDENSK